MHVEKKIGHNFIKLAMDHQGPEENAEALFATTKWDFSPLCSKKHERWCGLNLRPGNQEILSPNPSSDTDFPHSPSPLSLSLFPYLYNGDNNNNTTTTTLLRGVL